MTLDTTDDGIHQLCVRPVGGGKSLLFTRTLAVCLGQLTLAITPLLSLGADQTIKHQRNTVGARHNELNSVHLDEISNDVDMKLVAITEMERKINTFSTFVYASPQSLVTTEGSPSPLFLSFILENPQFLSMIVIDESHLLNEFGRFQKVFQMLKTGLFQKLQTRVPKCFLSLPHARHES